jgi:hypothetical protein
VPDIEKVECLHLNCAPEHEVGMESLLRLEGLHYLDVTDAVFPTGAFARLEHDLKANRNLELRSFGDWVELDFDK